LVAALALELILRALPVADATLALPVDEKNPVPRLQPDREFRYSKGWNFALHTLKRTNNHGFLSDYDYFRQGPRPLLAIIGDSYVEAMQVPNADALPAQMASLVGDGGRVYGLGLSGANLPTYLAYASYASRNFPVDAMVFVIIGNDYDESLLRYQATPRNHYFAEDPEGNLVLWRFDSSPSLLKRLGRSSALVRYLLINCQLSASRLRAAFAPGDAFVANTSASVDSRRLEDSRRAVDAFFRMLPESASLPPDRIAFLVDGLRPNLYSSEGMRAAHGSYPQLMRDYFMSAARGRGYAVVDLQPVFETRHGRDGSRFEFPNDNHWSAVGHRVAAAALCRSQLFQELFPAAGRACPG
jgi:hypothetical protein